VSNERHCDGKHARSSRAVLTVMADQGEIDIRNLEKEAVRRNEE